jgi:uncharacterized protein
MTVREIWRFPVKSMGGEQLTRVTVTDKGLVGDRVFAVVDGTDGKVASAKNPRKWARLLDCRATTAPDGRVDITFPDGSTKSGADPDIHEALSDLIGRPVRLEGEPAQGSVFEEVWPDIEGLAPPGIITATNIGTNEDGESISQFGLAMDAAPGTFFDVAGIHLMTTATLGRLGELAPGADFDVRRYRPNFLIGDDADPGFPENDWAGRRVQIGGSVVEVTIPTMRCVMTTLAQGSMPQDRETLRAIAAHNRVDIAGLGTWACAGAYANVVTPGDAAVGEAAGLI